MCDPVLHFGIRKCHKKRGRERDIQRERERELAECIDINMNEYKYDLSVRTKKHNIQLNSVLTT